MNNTRCYRNASSATQVTINVGNGYVGSLRITLLSPDRTPYLLKGVDLSDHRPDIVNQTVNASDTYASGIWKLQIIDTVKDSGFGRLGSWTLKT